MEQAKQTASYKGIAEGGGNWRFRFFCDISGELICEAHPVRADTEDAALEIAWQREGKQHFQQCRKCGRYVSSAMFNPRAEQCLDCAPWEDLYPNFCHHCGMRLSNPLDRYCPCCGVLLRNEGQGPEKEAAV